MASRSAVPEPETATSPSCGPKLYLKDRSALRGMDSAHPASGRPLNPHTASSYRKRMSGDSRPFPFADSAGMPRSKLLGVGNVLEASGLCRAPPS